MTGSFTSCAGIAVRRTASLSLAYVPRIHAFLEEWPRRGGPRQAWPWHPFWYRAVLWLAHPRLPLEFREHLELVLCSFANSPDHNAARPSRRKHPARIHVAKQFHCLAFDLTLYDFVDPGASHEHPFLCVVDQ